MFPQMLRWELMQRVLLNILGMIRDKYNDLLKDFPLQS